MGVKASFPAGAALALELLDSATGAFLVAGTRLIDQREEAGRRHEFIAVDVIPLALGKVPIRLRWTYTAQSASRSVTSPEIVLQVQEPALDDGGQIRDIRSPLRARPALWPWLVAAGLLAGGYRYWKNRRPAAPGAPETPVDARPPHVRAEAALRELGASGIWEQGRAGEFYLRLTDALRRYLEDGLAIAATKMTTGELSHRLRDAEVDRRLVNLLRGVFDRGDLAKFARTSPGPEQGPLDLAAGLEFVGETSPRELAPPAEVAR